MLSVGTVTKDDVIRCGSRWSSKTIREFESELAGYSIVLDASPRVL